MIDPITRWFVISQYDDKRAISIVNLFETTWLYRYPIPIEIMYHQGSEFIGHEFRKYVIEEEYRIVAKPSTSGNPMSNAILERIYQVILNLVQTCNITQSYADKYDPWSVILAPAEFSILSTTNSITCYIQVQLIFFRDIIIPIKKWWVGN